MRALGDRYRAAPAQARGALWLGLAVLPLLVLLVLYRQPLADWFWPETRVKQLRDAAELALARGHLTAADGSGARELYEAAIAIDPDRQEPRAGLARVADAALSAAEAALLREDYPAAHRHLALARELHVPRADADAFAERLRQREADAAGIDRLLVLATRAREAGRLDGDAQSALPLYQRILALQPERNDALEGREDALGDLLQRASAALRKGQLAEGAELIADAARYDAGHVDLPGARGQLTRAMEQAAQRSERELRNGRLQQAASGFARLLQIDAGHAVARRGQAAVASAYAERATREAADFEFAAAEQSLRQARSIDPASPAIPRAQARIAEARRTRSRLAARETSRGDAAQVQRLLDEAAAAQARGDLLTPPGESAYDKLRAARSLQPGSARVREAQAKLGVAAQRCFERELPRNNLGRAGSCLEAWGTLQGEGKAVGAGKRRLATRWLAIGDERLVAGELQSATSALRAAEAVDRATPGIAAFRERLRVAAASTD